MKRMSANNSSRKGVVKKTAGVVVHCSKRRSEPPVAEAAIESSEDSELSSEDDKKYLEEEPRTRAKKRSFAGKLLYLLIRINSTYEGTDIIHIIIIDVVKEGASPAPAPSGAEDSSSSASTLFTPPPPPPTYAEVLIRGVSSPEKDSVVVLQDVAEVADHAIAAAEVTVAIVPTAEHSVAAAEVTVAAVLGAKYSVAATNVAFAAVLPAAEHSVAATDVAVAAYRHAAEHSIAAADVAVAPGRNHHHHHLNNGGNLLNVSSPLPVSPSLEFVVAAEVEAEEGFAAAMAFTDGGSDADAEAGSSAEHAVVAAEEEGFSAAMAVTDGGSDASEFHYPSNRTPQKQRPYVNEDLPDQRDYLGRKLDLMKYNSPGNEQYIGKLLYSPGKRTYMSTPHPDSKSITFRTPVLQHAVKYLNNTLPHAHDGDDDE